MFDTSIIGKLIKQIDQHSLIAAQLRSEEKHMDYVAELAKIQGLITFISKEVNIIQSGISAEYGIATTQALGQTLPTTHSNSELSKLMDLYGIGTDPKTPTDKN